MHIINLFATIYFFLLQTVKMRNFFSFVEITLRVFGSPNNSAFNKAIIIIYEINIIYSRVRP